jgi:iron complex outermembrane receptor protein
VVVTAPPVHEEAAGRDVTAFATVIDTTSAPTRVETLDDALSDTAGVQVRRFGGLGDFSTLSVRGYAPGEVQIYLDGVPLSRADNETVNLADLPLDAVDHVEVYRGVTPLAFAQSGPAGVVNVVTRRPTGAPLTAASTSWGSFDTRKADLMQTGSTGAWDYLAFAHYLGSAGDFTFTNDQGTPNPGDDRTERRINNAFNLGDLTARIGWRPSAPLALALTTDTFVKENGVPGVATVQSRDAHASTLRQLAQLDAKLAGLPFEVAGSAWELYERQTFTAPFEPPTAGSSGTGPFFPTDTEESTLATGAQVWARGAVGSHHVPGLLLAASHEGLAEVDHIGAFGLLEPGRAPERTRLHATVAAEDEVLFFGERLSVVPAVRWEVFRDDFPGDPRVPPPLRTGGVSTSDFVSPRIGLRAEVWPGLTLLGNLARYTREPNLQELFGNRGVVRGNPELRPEVATNRDAGFRLTFPPFGNTLTGAAIEYAYFDNTIDDLIVLRLNTASVFIPRNVSAAHVRGSEVAARGRLWNRLSLVANYTHQDARDEGDDPTRKGNQLPGLPADEAYARVELAWSPSHPLPLGAWTGGFWPGRLSCDVNLIADDFLDAANTARRHVGSRAYLGAGIELALPLPGVSVSFEVKNATDDLTRDAFDFPLPGRTLFLTVSYGFGRGRGPE